jgi:RimJ/RimL family protein N-acetyltransferase
LFENRRIPIDVAMVQVTPPDAFGNACYFLNPSTNLGEVAYMILPEWQGTGLGSAMQACLIEHAKSQNIQGFVAEILTDKKNGQTCQARLR